MVGEHKRSEVHSTVRLYQDIPTAEGPSVLFLDPCTFPRTSHIEDPRVVDEDVQHTLLIFPLGPKLPDRLERCKVKLPHLLCGDDWCYDVLIHVERMLPPLTNYSHFPPPSPPCSTLLICTSMSGLSRPVATVCVSICFLSSSPRLMLRQARITAKGRVRVRAWGNGRRVGG